MKKSVKMFGIAGLIAAIAVGCSSPSVETGGRNQVEAGGSEAKVEQEKAPGKRFKSDVSGEFLGLNINVAEVAISPDKVEVGINFENKASDKVSWYPDLEAKAVIGDMQLEGDPLHDSGLTTGDIANGVKSDGSFAFIPAGDKKIDVKKVKEIKLRLGEVTSGNFTQTKNIELTVPVK
jgi:hypothetical protein